MEWLVTLQKSQKGQFLLQWPLLPHAEHTIVFLESAGCVAGPVPNEVPGQDSAALFLALVTPGPLPSADALVDLLVAPLCSSGSWWFLFELLTGGAHGGPPVCDVGAAGDGPCGSLFAGPKG